ncbi:MAG: dCTP deaminase [Bacilli bacterium]|nr:dCTP deaminase [Bacilli bacterium]
MILTGKKIKEEIKKGNITITPYNEENINPNSYNLTLANELLIYNEELLDMKKPNKTKKIIIPEEGIVLEPNKLYLGRTIEKTGTDLYAPMIEGRSSIGRLGIFVHITAGFGDIGFDGTWTLEIACLEPIRIYPYTKVCQISYHTLDGEIELYKSEKYQGQESVRESKLYKDFIK